MDLPGLASRDGAGAGHRPTAVAGRDGDRTVVWLAGELDLATMEVLTQTLARAIAVDDADLVVDLSEVVGMDAETVGVLVRSRDFLRSQSRDLVVRAPSECARSAVEVGGLGDLIDSISAAPPIPVRYASNGFSGCLSVSRPQPPDPAVSIGGTL